MGDLSCRKGKEACCGCSQSYRSSSLAHGIHQATILSTLTLLLTEIQEGGHLARSPGVCQDPGFTLGL